MLKRTLAKVLTLIMVLGLFASVSPISADAAKKPALKPKNVTLKVGQSKKISLKNAKKVKKTKWSVKPKNAVTLTKKSKKSVTVKGKKAAKKVTLTAKFKSGRKNMKATCTIRVNAKNPRPTKKPTSKPPASKPPASTDTPGTNTPTTDTPTTDTPATTPPGPVGTPEVIEVPLVGIRALYGTDSALKELEGGGVETIADTCKGFAIDLPAALYTGDVVQVTLEGEGSMRAFLSDANDTKKQVEDTGDLMPLPHTWTLTSNDNNVGEVHVKPVAGENFPVGVKVTKAVITYPGGSQSTPPPVTPPPGAMDEAVYKEMVGKSLVPESASYTMNNHLVKNAIDKAKNGENVTIAYLGGSITEGAAATSTNCYAYLSQQYFKDTFANDKDKVTYVNAGISGTPSSLGVMRYERDVLKQGKKLAENVNPDILFIEFSVNDFDDSTNKQGYESLIRTALKANTGVILIFTHASYGSTQSKDIPIGQHYGLPMISIGNAITGYLGKELPETGANGFYSPDILHPSVNGHKIMADFVNNCFDKIAAEAKDEALTIPAAPKNAGGDRYEGMKWIDRNTTGIDITPGGFSGTYINPPQGKMIDGWQHTSAAGTEPFTMKLTCKNFLIAYQYKGTNPGAIEVWIDGEKQTKMEEAGPNGTIKTIPTIDASSTSGGWGGSTWTTVALKDTEAKERTIEIKMTDATKQFTIFGFGYN